MRFIVLLDACVLYPAPLRDFLLRLAGTGLFAAKWTAQIHEERITRLLEKRPELEPQLARTKDLMDQAVPDALVRGYESLVAGLELPDPGDRQVLAAAIYCNAQMIKKFLLPTLRKPCIRTCLSNTNSIFIKASLSAWQSGIVPR